MSAVDESNDVDMVDTTSAEEVEVRSIRETNERTYARCET
jgi:hypothetical protein